MDDNILPHWTEKEEIMKSKSENLFELIGSLIEWEKTRGVVFKETGLPIFETWMFASEAPNEMLPYRHRNAALEKKTASICFYEPDVDLYRRLEEGKLELASSELKKFGSFVGFDLSIFTDFITPFQEFYVLANLVIDLFFLLNGKRMIPNLRADETGGASYFGLFEKAPVVCCGTLGCSLRKRVRDKNTLLISRYAEKHQDQLIIQYGPNLVKADNTTAFPAFGWRMNHGQR